MLFKLKDFKDKAININENFQSQLPGKEILADSLLDPGLDISSLGVAGERLKSKIIDIAARDTLKLSQILVGRMATSIGFLSDAYGPVSTALTAIDGSFGSSKVDSLSGNMLATSIGSASQYLSMVPNPYVQLAAAIINVGTTIFALAVTNTAPSISAMPSQKYDEDTDQGQVNFKILNYTQQGLSDHKNNPGMAYDYSNLFAPRFSGDPAIEYRSQGRVWGIAFGFGKAGIEDDPSRNGSPFRANKDSFGDTGLGYVPGGNSITSVIQCFPMEPLGTGLVGKVGSKYGKPDAKDWAKFAMLLPFMKNPQEIRCNPADLNNKKKRDACLPLYPERGAGHPAAALDVGQYYPASNNALNLIQNMCMSEGPALFCIDTDRLLSEWADYYDAALDGIKWFWKNKKQRNFWGETAWKSMLGYISTGFIADQFPTYKGKKAVQPSNLGGGIGHYVPPPDGDLKPQFFDQWKKYNLFNYGIKNYLKWIKARQIWYLNNTQLAAYLPPKASGYKGGYYITGAINWKNNDLMNAWVDARRRILTTYERDFVNIEDVIDHDFKKLLEERLDPGQKVSASGHLKAPEHYKDLGKPKRATKSDFSGDLTEPPLLYDPADPYAGRATKQKSRSNLILPVAAAAGIFLLAKK